MDPNISPAAPDDMQEAPIFDLPPELVHSIFERLKQADVLQARLVCRLFARIGLDHMLDTVSIVYKRDQFERLGKIAGHPMAKSVRSFCFQADRFERQFWSYEDWKGELLVNPYRPAARNAIAIPSDWDILNLAASAARRRAMQHADLRTQLGISSEERVANSEVDLSFLTTFFTGCGKLDHVTLALCEGADGLIVPNPKLFEDTILRPYGDFTILDQGVDQFWVVAEALRQSGRAIKHFTATNVSHRILSPVWREAPTDSIIKHLMTELREFRIEFTCRDDDEDQDPKAEVDIQLHHGQGLLAHWLSSGQDLRVIKICTYAPKRHYPAPDLQNAFGTETWPKLRELGLSDFSTTEDDLVDLLLRHAKSLRRLSLSDIELLDGSWESTFRRVAGQLTKLKKVRLRGLLRDPEGDLVMNDLDFDGTRIDEWRDNIENCLLYGREMPDLTEEAKMNLNDPLVEDVPGYRKPGRLDDEDAGYTTDGSAISYGSDALDARI